MRAVWIALGTDSVVVSGGTCKHGNDGGDSWSKDGSVERDRLYAG